MTPPQENVIIKQRRERTRADGQRDHARACMVLGEGAAQKRRNNLFPYAFHLDAGPSSR